MASAQVWRTLPSFPMVVWPRAMASSSLSPRRCWHKAKPSRGSNREETMTNKETKIELPEELPEGLPVPEDDGAADHLPGKQLPSVALKSTAGASWISPPSPA